MMKNEVLQRINHINNPKVLQLFKQIALSFHGLVVQMMMHVVKIN